MENRDAFKLEYYEKDDGWYWKVTAANGEVVLATGNVDQPGGFASRQSAERNFKLSQRALLTL